MNEEAKKLVDEIKSALNDRIETQKSEMDAKLNKSSEAVVVIEQKFEDIQKKIDGLKGNSEALNEIKNELEKINEAQKAQGEAISDMTLEHKEAAKGNNDDYSKAIRQALVNAGFVIKSDNDGGEIVSKGNAVLGNMSATEPVTVKAAHVMGAADVTGNAIPLDFSTMGKDIIPVNTNDHVTDFFTTKSTSETKMMTLLIEYDVEGDLATTAEGTASGLISIKLKSKDFMIFEESVMSTISWRENANVPELMSAIKRIVPDKIKQRFDLLTLTTGGDNSAAPWGAMNSNNGTAFNALEYAGLGKTVANEVDLITFMKNQCRTADYSANGIYMGDKKRLEIAAIRDANNNNVADRRLNFGGDGELNKVAGLTIKETRLLPDTLLVSVTNMNRIKLAKNMTVTVGFNADDLSKRRVSTVFSALWAYGSQNVNANIWTNSIAADLVIINEAAAASLTRINGYATGSDASDMTIQMMINAGGTTVIPANLADYKTGVAAATGVANAAALQVLIDAAN